MEISREQIGEPIFAGDGVLAILKKDKKGILIGFYLHPQDISEKLMMLDLGEIIRVFMTKPEMGA